MQDISLHLECNMKLKSNVERQILSILFKLGNHFVCPNFFIVPSNVAHNV
jgi:hypothetical protein